MENTVHTMSNLFAQLGVSSDEAAISQFIEMHTPLPGGMQLHEAGFWTDAQASFLREAISQDADWAEVADSLNAQLHGAH
jgi:Protein of unknown function (DUF2789)